MKRTALTAAQRSLLEELIVDHGLVVSTQDVLQKLSFETEESKYRFVSQLKQAGWLVRIKQGLYQIADVSSLGTLTLSRYAIAHLLLPESYVSFEAALQHHGLFDQSLHTISSVGPKQKAAVQLQGTVYRFVRTKTAYYFGYTPHPLNGCQVQIAEPEKALIDLLQFHRTSARVDLVLETLTDNRHQVEIARLAEWALRSPIAVQRVVGFLLDQLGLDTSTLGAGASQSNSVTKLTDGSNHFSSKWRLYYDPFFSRQHIAL